MRLTGDLVRNKLSPEREKTETKTANIQFYTQ